MTATESSGTTPAKSSLLEDCFDIWYAPSSVFERRAKGGALGPFLVCTVLLMLLFYAAMGPLQGVFDAQVAKTIAEAQADKPSMTGEQLAGMQGVIEKSVKFGGLVFLPILLLLVGVGVWLASKILGGTLSFAGGIMVASFAYLPKALEMLLITAQSFVMDTSTWRGQFQFSWGFGRFMDPTGPQGLTMLLGRIDLFTIWVTILFALGLIHAGKVEKTKAYAGAAVLWVIGAIPAVIQLVSGK